MPSKNSKKAAQTEAEKVTFARVMFAEGKDIDEVTQATGFDREKAGGIKGFMGQEQGKKWYQDYLAKTGTGIETEPTAKNPAATEGETVSQPPQKVSTGFKLDQLELNSDAATALRSILKRTLGVPSPQASALLQEVDGESDSYAHNPIQLYDALTVMGLSNDRAKSVSQQFASKVSDRKTRERFARAVLDIDSPPEQKAASSEDRFDRLFDRAMKLREMDMLAQVMPTSARPYAEGGRDGRQERIDKIMDRAEEYKVMSTIFRDESGLQQQGYEEVTEYEQTKGENGQIEQIPIRTVKRPIPIAHGYPGQGAQEGDELDRILAKFAKVALVKSLSQMNGPMGMGMGYMPGMGMTQEPLLDDEGAVLLDKTGQPVMKVSYTPYPSQSGQGNVAELVEKQTDGMLRVVEAMKSGEKSPEAFDLLTKLLIDRVDKMSDQQMATLQRQIEALEGSDPLGYVTDVLDRLGKAGLLGEKGGQNLEVAKLHTDLDRWKFEKEDDFKKWSWQMKQEMEDKKYARKQLEEFGRTVRDGIKEVAAPVAKSFAEGANEAMARGKKGAAAPSRTQPGPSHDPTAMSNDELVESLAQVNRAANTVQDARKNLVVEMQKRNLPV